MRSCVGLARTVFVLAAFCAGASACAGGAREASPEPKSGGGEGIGLGNFDAGADAQPGKRTNGRLAPEAIQKVVRAKFDPMRRCYEAGLTRNKELQGRVSVKFVIDLEGAVVTAGDFASELPDREVVECVVA